MFCKCVKIKYETKIPKTICILAIRKRLKDGAKSGKPVNRSGIFKI